MALDEIRQARLAKLQKLRDKGIDPYPAVSHRTHRIADVLRDFDDHVKNKDHVIVAGRVMARREHGGSTFVDLRDGSGNMQVYFKKDVVGDDVYELLNTTTDIGDFIEVNGTLFVTKKEEKSVQATEYRMLTKSVMPLPDKWHGLQDIEERYRKRYIDMIMNPEIAEMIMMRQQIIEGMREYFLKNGYDEVYTPILQPMYGGGSARPFKAYLNALNMDVYMRVSDEMYLKRLIVGGMDRVFEFSTDFRNEGVDKTHNPEFTIMEAMIAYADYEDGMDVDEAITEYVVKKIKGTTKITYQGIDIDFAAPWDRISVRDAVKKYADIDIENISDDKLKEVLKQNDIQIQGEYVRGNAIMGLIEEFAEPKFMQPTILHTYPRETSPLAKLHRDDPRYVERFELFAYGMEFGNNYSELTDASILRENWEEQEEALRKGDDEAQRTDHDYLNAIEIGMPPTCGIAISIDRLAMFLTDQKSIRDVIPFPFMKPKGHVVSQAGKAKDTMIAVALINDGADMEPWQKMNTIAHLNAAFGAREGRELFMQDTIKTKDNVEINLNIQHAIMIKTVDSNEAIRKLIDKAQTNELEIAEFTKEMQETTDDKKVAKWTREQDRNDVEYYGVLIYGKKSVVEKLTKDFKLFK